MATKKKKSDMPSGNAEIAKMKKQTGKAKVKFSDGTTGEIDPVDDVYDNTGSRQTPSPKRAVAEKPALKKTTQNAAGTRVTSGGGEDTSGTTPKASSQTGSASGKKAAPKYPQATAGDMQKVAGDFGEQINAPRKQAQSDLSRLIGTTTTYDPTGGSRAALGTLGKQKAQIGGTDVNVGARQASSVLGKLMSQIGKQPTTPQLVQAYNKLMGYAGDVRGMNLTEGIDPMIAQLTGLSNQILSDPRINDAIYNLQKRGVQIDPNAVNAELLNELASQRAYTGGIAGTDTGFGPDWAKQSADLIRSQVGREGVEARNKLAARMTGQGLGGGAANNAMRLLQQEISTAIAEGAKKAALEGEAGRQTGILAKMKSELEARGLSAGTANNIAQNSINALKAGADIDAAALQALLGQKTTAADIMKAAAALTTDKANIRLGQAQTVGDLYNQGAGVASNIASERMNKNQLLAGLGGNRASVLSGMDKNTLAKLDMLTGLTGQQAGIQQGMDTLGMQKMDLLGQLQGQNTDLANAMSGGIAQGFAGAQDLNKSAVDAYKTQAGLYGQAQMADALRQMMNPPMQTTTPADRITGAGLGASNVAKSTIGMPTGGTALYSANGNTEVPSSAGAFEGATMATPVMRNVISAAANTAPLNSAAANMRGLVTPGNQGTRYGIPAPQASAQNNGVWNSLAALLGVNGNRLINPTAALYAGKYR